MRRLKPHVHRWLWIGCVGFGFIAVAVMLVLLNLNDRTTAKELLFVGSDPNAVASPLPVAEPLLAVEHQLELPKLDFPIGSVEEACGLNEFPTYWNADGALSTNRGHTEAKILESEECRTALEAHLSTLNPYLWFQGAFAQQFSFVVLDHPLTFGRIFTDPMGDFLRVQNALTNPECLLKGDETNWELQETCHADALLNYALVRRICFNSAEGRERTLYWPEDNPTPEQDRHMWKQDLEEGWIEHKCEELDQSLKLTANQTELLSSLLDQNEQFSSMKDSGGVLVELAARLGDAAAGLTWPYMSSGYTGFEEGYKYGRFNELLNSSFWWDLKGKREPSKDRLGRTVFVMGILKRDHIEFDWKWLAEHLCTPPYEDDWKVAGEKPSEPKSCRAVIDELYTVEELPKPLLEFIDQLSLVALELDVYD